MIGLGLLLLLFLLLLAAAMLLRWLHPLPSLEGRPESHALADASGTRLAMALDPLARDHPGLSGIFPLAGARDSFAARVQLVRAAERTLDLQYYIWHGDISGRLLLDELLRAAQRGVRVRLLLDDMGSTGLDELLAALDTHPLIEVRLFNPVAIRSPRMLGYLADLRRLNRRMHNKSLTADNRATIVGGRNIGDEYFGISETGTFADLDVLAAGAIVPLVSADFDRYWASASAFPVSSLLPRPPGKDLQKLVLGAVGSEALAIEYAAAIDRSILANGMTAETIPFLWAPVTMVSDDPLKALGKARRADLLMVGLAAAMGVPERQVALVSAYFVPTDTGRDAFAALAGQGVEVNILTNALSATDVALVHTGYARHRRKLLRAGVRLWEMKPEGDPAVELGFLGSRGAAGGSVLQSSVSSLHAKTFATDRQRMFVGSFNFDPRSAMLNTELGFLIESPALAGGLHDLFDRPEEGVARIAYEVRLADDGKALRWIERTASGDVVHSVEPGTGPLQRAILWALALLPLDWLL